MIVKSLKDRAIFDLGDGTKGSVIEFGRRMNTALKKSGVVKTPEKISSEELIEEVFPEVPRGEDSYTANIIDIFKSIATDKDGNQYQKPKYKNVPKVKVEVYEGPTTIQMLQMYKDNLREGGSEDFEEFKTLLLNREYNKIRINPDDYLEKRFDGEPKTIKEAHSFYQTADYEDLDMKEALLKVIYDRTGFGLGALFQEEIDDRKRGL